MLTINLGTNSCDFLDGKGNKYNVYWDNITLPVKRYAYERLDRPPIALYYDYLINKYPPDTVLKELIRMYLPIKYFRTGHYEKVPMVIGFIGSRGSGKSCGAAQVAVLDYLVRGLPVWSNMPVSMRVKYKDVEATFEAETVESLDVINMNAQTEGLLLIDEVNMTAAEGSRHMAAANLQFSYAMQQVRKKKMSVIWTCQGWNWLDGRLRWQTDFCVACADAYLRNSKYATGVGSHSVWHVYDLSGMTGEFPMEYGLNHHYIADFQVYQGLAWNEPFWAAYDSFAVQGKADYIQDFKDSKRSARQIQLEAWSEDQRQPVREFLDDMLGQGITRIDANTLWSMNGITDRSTQTVVGRLVTEAGWTRRQGTSGHFYEFQEKDGNTVIST